jgi:hypothetical protein
LHQRENRPGITTNIFQELVRELPVSHVLSLPTVDRHLIGASPTTGIGNADTTFVIPDGSNNLFLSKGFPWNFLILSSWANGRKSRLFSASSKRPCETFLLDKKTGLSHDF